MNNMDWRIEPDLLVVKFGILNVGLEGTEKRLKAIASIAEGHHVQRLLFIVRSKDDYEYSIFEILDYAKVFVEHLAGLRAALVDNTPSASPARQTMGNAIFALLVPDKIFTVRLFRHERAARHWLDALPPRIDR